MQFLASFTVVALLMGVFATADASAQKEKKKEDKTMTYIITVKQGNKELGKIELKLWPDVAPKHCAFFDARVAEGFYDDLAFHRVIPNFMIQGGDPNTKDQPRNSWGSGGYKEKVQAEFNSKKHVRGVLSAARTQDPNSFSGQFFLCVADSPWLDNQYTAFGEAVSGMEVADIVVNSPRDAGDCPLEKITFSIVKGK
ncbi:MAG TPA: peptidylprolyl isomerase [Candidatus Didemnitutus sp.]|nr:peptidylprolyl isomerase [Candidatus Didemnitutus sp.]